MPARTISQTQQHSEGATKMDVPRLEDDIRRHDWLFTDGPYHLGRPAVQHWAEEQTLSIKLGNSPLPPMKIGPVEYLHHLIDEFIDPTSSFHIIADFEQGKWPEELGYRRLGDYLAYLGTHELDFGSWTKLEICLPDVGIRYNAPSTPLIPLDALNSLRNLQFYGHRNQLVDSWLPLTPSIIQSLFTLDINCEIAVEDCVRILLHGKRLKTFLVDNIEPNTDEVLVNSLRSPTKYRSGEHDRPYLEFLRIKSAADITPLLHPFFFPSLKTLNLVLSYPTKLRSLPPAFEWKNLENSSLVCDITNEDSQWIRDRCNPNGQHNHINLCPFLEHAQR
ncbi:hypothetical protein H0H87_009991 [Tephrocybe sp. NHM501043]|nr:hypothetical protein H0H87_009991 [Tephrocybe sp. NHM501043]